MYSLKFLLAGVATLATLSSALPVVSPLGSSIIPGVNAPALPRQLDVPALVSLDVDAVVDVEVLDKRCPGCPTVDPVPEVGGDVDAPEVPVTVPSIILDLNADLGEILGQIELVVAVNKDGVAVDINVAFLLQLLEDVKNLIGDAIADLASTISSTTNGGLDALLGGVLTAVQFCGLIITLLKTIIAILATVLTGLSRGQVDVSVLGDAVAIIVGLTAELLATVVDHVDVLTGILAPLVASAVGTLGGLGVDYSPITQVVAGQGL